MQAAQDWIEAFEKLDTPRSGALSDWRRATATAAGRLASRIAAHPVNR